MLLALRHPSKMSSGFFASETKCEEYSTLTAHKEEAVEGDANPVMADYEESMPTQTEHEDSSTGESGRVLVLSASLPRLGRFALALFGFVLALVVQIPVLSFAPLRCLNNSEATEDALDLTDLLVPQSLFP